MSGSGRQADWAKGVVAWNELRSYDAIMSIQTILIGLSVFAALYLGYFWWAVKYRNGREKEAQMQANAVRDALENK